MSLPQRPLLPASSVAGMDEKTPRLGGGPFPFLCPTSSPSAVFPQLQIFPNSMQQYQLFHLMQMVQQQQQQQQRLSAGASPVNSDQASSRSESPQTKKLVLDEDGCATCSVCTEKVPEAQWNQHIELEKERLIQYITTTKEKRERDRENTPEHFDQKRKREMELQRIRNNQSKRLSLKRGSAIVRDCLTPFSRQSNDETGSSESPDMKKDEDFFLKCSTCHQPCAYAIVMSSFDRPKCQLCFDLVRAAVLTSSGSPETSNASKDDMDGSPVCKKMKIEDLIDTSI